MFLLTMILVVGVTWGSLFWNRLGKVSGGGTPKARAAPVKQAARLTGQDGELRQLWPKVVAQASSTAIYPPALSRSALHNQATNFSISEKRPPWHLASFKELIDYNQNSFYLNWNIFLRTGITPNGSVALHFKILTYYLYAPFFHYRAPCPWARSAFLRWLVLDILPSGFFFFIKITEKLLIFRR